ncbi:MAG: DUF1553 domain-containing protein [Planctomycetaceae bacterium]|nr:DUF1553 domain-containing protein [Planctomycetaceae bacterium]
MNSQSRLELLSIVDDLCEQIATQEQCARLEELLLNDPVARRLYLDAIELHGQLHWDAAGLGNRDSLLDSELEVALAAQLAPAIPARRKRNWGLVAAASVLVLVASGWWWSHISVPSGGSRPELAHHESPPSPPSVDLPVIPSVMLPGERQAPATEPDSLPVERVVDIGLPQETQLSLVSVINEELSRGWRDNNVVPNSLAGDAEWLRRIHLDLAGRIPTVTEAENFLKDKSPDKRSRVLDRLLEGSEFAGHFSLIWTNLLVGRMPRADIDRGALQDYLRRQFAANRPWSEVVTDLITAEGSGKENGAANFLLAHLNNEAVPATAYTARVLLGQQMQCTQCHRHPSVAAWGQEQFWEFNACFQQTQVREQRLVDAETGERRTLRELVDVPGVAGSYYETLQGVMKVAYPGYNGHEILVDGQTNRRAELAKLMLSGDENDVARAMVNRIWAHFFGYGFTSPIDDLGPHNPVSHPELFHALTKRFIHSGYDVRDLVEAICRSNAYQLSSSVPEETALDDPEHGTLPLFSRAYVKRLSPEQMFNSLLVASGTSSSDIYNSRETARLRDQWLRQFFEAEETEENVELTTFDGSLPQALSLMNGELVRQATDLESGKFVSGVVNTTESDVEKIRRICLATLSRYPTPAELQNVRVLLRSYVHQRSERNVPPRIAAAEGYSDLYWAYLNSSEFSVNH